MEFPEAFTESTTDDPIGGSDGESSPIPFEILQINVRVVDVLSDYTVSGVLHSFTPGEVAILTSEPLSQERTVAVHLSSFFFEGQILYSAPYESQYEAHISIDDVERKGLRRTPRFPVTIPAELLRPSGDSVAITIRDLSRDGMGIESPIPVKAGQPVAIVSGPAFVFAIVRHCQETPGGLFRAGVEMHHLFEGPGQAAAEHLRPTPPRPKWLKWFSKEPHGVSLKPIRNVK
jgi:hypothetical protein